MLEDVFHRIEQARGAVIAWQRDLVSTQAIGPEYGGQGEVEKAALIRRLLKDIGLPEPQEFRAPDDRVPSGYRPSLSCVIPGKDTSRTFWIMSHMDVVPAGDLSLWTTNPFELTVDGDELIGRGVEDNHHGIVVSLALAKSLVESGTVPSMNLGLLFIADEETGNKLGIDFLLKNHRDIFGERDLFLVPDSGSPDSLAVEIAEAGVLWIKVTVTGKQCHASMPHHGINSLRAASEFIVRLPEIESKFAKQDPLFDPPRSTIEPTRKEENVPNINTIPGCDVFYIDCRVLPHYDIADVLSAIKELGQDIEARHRVSISYETPQYSKAAPMTAPDSPIISLLCASIERECSTRPRVQGVGGGTVGAFLRRAGYAAAVWSTIYENPHVPNERSNVSFVLKDARILARVLCS